MCAVSEVLREPRYFHVSVNAAHRMSRVGDGRKHTRRGLAAFLCVSCKKIVPLWNSLYSSQAPSFAGENDEISCTIHSIHQASDGRGIFVMDGGGDRDRLFLSMIDEKVRFLIRLRGDRHLLCAGEKKSALDLANQCRCSYSEVIAKTEAGKQEIHEISFGYREVRLP